MGTQESYIRLVAPPSTAAVDLSLLILSGRMRLRAGTGRSTSGHQPYPLTPITQANDSTA